MVVFIRKPLLARFFFFGMLFVTNSEQNEPEIVPNEVSTIVDNNPLILNGKTCGLIATIKSTLESSESMILFLQELLHTSKAKANELEKFSCETEVCNNKKEEARLLVNDTEGTSSSKSIPAAANCYELKEKFRFYESGIYRIWPRYLNRSVNVFCDMATTTGGWTVIQRRMDKNSNQENFLRNWHDYKTGFGELNSEFWIGNDVIFALSNEGSTVLRVDMEDFEGVKRYALYNNFQVSTEPNKYQLKVEGYTGDAGDSMSKHNNLFFHTFDNDQTALGCAQLFKGGWWYGRCHTANLNGLYLRGSHKSHADGVNWHEFKGHYYSLKKVEMKVRPLLK